MSEHPSKSAVPETTITPLPLPEPPKALTDALALVDRRADEEARKMIRQGFSPCEAHRRARVLAEHARRPYERAIADWIATQPVRVIMEERRG